MKSLTINQIATLVSGTVIGDGNLTITGASPIRDAGAGDITLADDPRYASKLTDCQAVAVIRPIEFPNCEITCVVVSDVHAAFATLVKFFDPPVSDTFQGISPLASISVTARIGRDCVIEPFAVIGDHVELGDQVHVGAGSVIESACRIGDRTRIFARCVLYAKTEVGCDCRIHAGAVLGADGFGYNTRNGRHELSAQLGNVVIGDAVEIGANSTIDRGTYNATVIGSGTKIDNLVMIAHNNRLGKHNLICSQVGMAGSCRTGDYVVMGGQVGIGDHVDIGEQTTLGAQSGVMNHIPAKSVYLGSPALPIRDQLKNWAVLGKINEWYQKWKDMLRRIDQIERILHQVEVTDAQTLGQSRLASAPVTSKNESTRRAA